MHVQSQLPPACCAQDRARRELRSTDCPSLTCVPAAKVSGPKKSPGSAGAFLLLQLPMQYQRASSVNLLKATPRSQPLPLPDSASDTLPLVMAWPIADFLAPAVASAEA